MVKKLKSGNSAGQATHEAGQTANSIRESAEKIWLAGLGAFAKARQEPTKAFEILVREGLSLQSKTKALAEERLGDVSGKVSEVKSQLSNRATESWDKLEQVFEDRVSRALERLGVPARKDVQALIKRVDDLTAALEAMGGKLPSKTPARKAAARPKATKATKASKAAKAPKASKAEPMAAAPAEVAEAPAKARKPRARKAAA